MLGFGSFGDNGKGTTTTKFACVVLMISMVMIGGIAALATLIRAA